MEHKIKCLYILYLYLDSRLSSFHLGGNEIVTAKIFYYNIIGIMFIPMLLFLSDYKCYSMSMR